MVLVLLGLGAAFVLPTLRLPTPVADTQTVLERARATAIRRGESVRLATDLAGGWTVRATADTAGDILLAGTTDGTASAGISRSIVITALGTCLPDGGVAIGTAAWDPTRCAVANR
jgi:Type II transport protein GspH